MAAAATAIAATALPRFAPRSVSLLLGVLVAAPWAARAATIDPRFATNLTLYHVNELSYPTEPVNMNTADIDGDMYFDLRSRGIPLECGIWRNESWWSHFDCSNPEVANVSKLAVTKLVVEVDMRWGDYADCNVDPVTGIYSCDCTDVPDNCTSFTTKTKCNNANSCEWDDEGGRCDPDGCANITDRLQCEQGYHKCVWHAVTARCGDPPDKVVCNHTLVGSLNLSLVNWGQNPQPGFTPSTVDYWHANVLRKIRGLWYSTWADGECRPDDPSQVFCSWRVVATVKKISKECSDAAFNAVIVQGDKIAPWGARCFDGCSAAEQKNTTSKCWLECFYANVLGRNGSSQFMNYSSPESGIPLSELRTTWNRPFLPVAQGGCPSVLPSASPVVGLPSMSFIV